MKNLQELQNDFVKSLYHKDDLKILPEIKNSVIAKEELLNIYRNNLHENLKNTLKITYPKIYQLTKEKKFATFCQEFIKKNRSISGNLDDYGGNFCDFLAQQNELFLSDLAKLEWLGQKSYLAKNVDFLDIKALQELPPEKLFDVKFEINPSCFLLNSSYNLLGRKKQNKPPKRQKYFVIYRLSFEVIFEQITKEEFVFLNGAKEGLALFKIYEKHNINVQKYLQKYLANGVLYHFSFEF
jgi:hypothetical protein